MEMSPTQAAQRAAFALLAAAPNLYRLSELRGDAEEALLSFRVSRSSAVVTFAFRTGGVRLVRSLVPDFPAQAEP